DLGVDLIHLPGELEGLLRELERAGRVGLRGKLSLGRPDRRERRVAADLDRDPRATGQTLARALAVPVLGVLHRDVVEGARDLVEGAQLLVDLERALVVPDRELDVA